MLRGLALDYYYTNYKNVSYALPFKQMIFTTCNYFKGLEYKCNVLKR
jgi:hypothetical protein